MRSFVKVAHGVDTLPVLLALQRQPELWGQNAERAYAPDTPHSGMTDIWVRYNDRRPFDAGERPFSEINDEHDSIWYPAAAKLPELRPILFGLMSRVEGERLGGVMITKLPPGGRIEGHTDGGWHAGYYDKYYVALKAEPGTAFWFQPEGSDKPEVILAQTGDIYHFRNDIVHGVHNESAEERIALIVCIRHSKP
jgi:quercetin dioxygenase-like cupin family protein